MVVQFWFHIINCRILLKMGFHLVSSIDYVVRVRLLLLRLTDLRY